MASIKIDKNVRNAVLMGLARKGAEWAQAEYRKRTNWTVSIAGDDDLFYEVQAWLMAQERINAERRNVTVRSTISYDNSVGGVLDAPKRKASLQIAFDGDQVNRVVLDGHQIDVCVQNPEGPITGELVRVIKPPRLVFTARNRAGRDAIYAHLLGLHQEKHKKERKPALFIIDKYTDWSRRSDLPGRTMDSVVVKGNVLEKLRDDLKDFQSREAEYVRRGIPYHRAYLLTGPPGTGKTSSVKAVANSLGMDLWYAALSDLSKDAKLVDLLSDVRSGGILLLEDVDSFGAATSRKTEKEEVSASGLLNALDGVATPHGLVTIMTTNYPDKLDPALMRPGRIDRIFDFQNPDSDTIHRHFKFFYGRPASYQGEWPEGRSSAEVSEIFKRHIDDSRDAELELLGY